MSKSKKKTNPLPTDRDSLWKEVIEVLFEDLILFCLPNLHEAIDFSVKPVFLEQELPKLFPEWNKKGKRLNDKLAKVKLKNGLEKWILIHIEAQEKGDPYFPERMFVYFYRILDRRKLPITALAIYTGSSAPSSPGIYRKEFFGTEIVYKFNTLPIRKQREEDLKKSSNPFAMAALAGLYTIKSKSNPQKRHAFKRQLFRLLKERNFSREKIVNLIIFIQYLVNLPADLNTELNQEINFNYQKPDLMKLTPEMKFEALAPFLQSLVRHKFGMPIEELAKIDGFEAKLEAITDAKAEIKAIELAEAKVEALAEAKVEALAEEITKAKEGNNIVRLFELAKMPPKQIAQILDLEVSYITKVLKEKGIIS